MRILLLYRKEPSNLRAELSSPVSFNKMENKSWVVAHRVPILVLHPNSQVREQQAIVRILSTSVGKQPMKKTCLSTIVLVLVGIASPSTSSSPLLAPRLSINSLEWTRVTAKTPQAHSIEMSRKASLPPVLSHLTNGKLSLGLKVVKTHSYS